MLYSIAIYGLALVPALLWLRFFLKKDWEPEPKKYILSLFILGAIIVVPTGLVENFVEPLIGVSKTNYTSVTIFLLVAAGIEEIAKFIAAYFFISNHPKEFDEAEDGMIYLIVVALGFAAGENLLVTFNIIKSSHLIVTPLAVLGLRSIGATAIHAMSSGIVGYWLARSVFEGRKYFILRGLGFATIVHFIFNGVIKFFSIANIPFSVTILVSSVVIAITFIITIIQFKKLHARLFEK